jgi:hypothetical protein
MAARKVKKAVAKPKPAKDSKLAKVEQGLILMSQHFTQAAKKFAEENGASVFVRISLIPTLKEKGDGHC